MEEVYKLWKEGYSVVSGNNTVKYNLHRYAISCAANPNQKNRKTAARLSLEVL